LNSLDI